MQFSVPGESFYSELLYITALWTILSNDGPPQLLVTDTMPYFFPN